MKFNEIATVSGKAGLYKILKPTRSGVILESMDDKKGKLVVGANQRVSVLSEISIYTMTEEGASPLEDIMIKIEAEFKGDLGLDSTADGDELKAFLKHVLPEFDEDKVYPSDIKKLVSWYKIIRNYAPEVLEEQTEEQSEEEKEA
ncbi:DUF5606 family protein [Belliella aquatica]|uniref:DUF5606 domain-containing protein n=1 Tax=Belliella aquatica TaxID=1323734 RepID=A0ABQ1MT69_9BACT|nr:DUF5606 domain-containing protein [Belliella aquatica]MCH7405327.1 DUF5606 domain-containing protein [Belliella aquatica]GGC42515.1 hypothetical protein GCM10010993_21390 [Belliella aquatica]